MRRVIPGASTIFLVVGLALMTYFVASGTTVDVDGVVVEEFWAWGLGVGFVILSLLGYALWGLVKLIAWLRSR